MGPDSWKAAWLATGLERLDLQNDADMLICDDSNCLCRQGPPTKVHSWGVATASEPCPQQTPSSLKGTVASSSLTSCIHFTDKSNVAPRRAEASHLFPLLLNPGLRECTSPQ